MDRKPLSFVFLALVLFSATACADYKGIQPTASLYYTPYSTLTPLSPTATITPPIISTTTLVPTNTLTTTPEPGTPLGCLIINEDGKLYILSNKEFYAFGPDDDELDQALADHYPEWANFTQSVQWSSEPAKVGEIVSEASFDEKFALNPAVTLTTLGTSLDWQIPPDGDLFAQAFATGERLVRLWDEYSHPDHESVRASYPEVSNGATYALYVFFDYDKEKLQVWCETYQGLFGTSPLHR